MIRTLALLTLMVAAAGAPAAKVLDRVVATVNGRPILQSELDDEFRYESFMAAKPLTAGNSEMKAALDRLIDQELINGQARAIELKPLPAAEIDQKIEALKTDLAHGSDAEWNASLVKYGLTQGDIRTHMELELNQFRIIEARLRPSIQISVDEIQTYYQSTVLPALPPGQRLTLKDATPQIRELLTEQKIDQALDSWLESLRAQAQIRRFSEFAAEAQKP